MKTNCRRPQEIFPRVVILACIMLVWPTSAFALNPMLEINQYGHSSWRIRDGFPKGQILAIAQTSDGYLWLGTEFGLVRFDGVTGVPWQPQDQPLLSSQIFSLLASHDGTLWIGTAKGLASLKDGKVIEYPELAGRYLFKIIEDRNGVIWASGAAVSGGKLCAIQQGKVQQCYGEDGALGRGAFSLYEDSKGNLWAGVKTGLWRWRPGPPQFFPLPGEADGIQGLGEDDDGTLLIGWHGGIYRFVDGKTEPFRPTNQLRQFRANRILRDRDGALWIGTVGQGLLHVHQRMTDMFALSDNLSGETVYALFEDREGTLWVSTVNGLDRFRDYAVATFNAKQGFSNLLVSILAARDKSLWVGALDGLSKWNYGSPRYPKLDGVKPNSLFEDNRGQIWVSTQNGIGYLKDDRFIPINSVPGGVVTSMTQDRAGNLWVANEHVGLYQLLEGKVVQEIPWSRLGHKDHASVVAADPLQDGLWIGFFNGGIAYLSEGQIRASYTAAEGLGAGRVSGLRFDQDGTLWVGTEGGLSRLKAGRVATMTSKNGLPCNAVNWVIKDDADSLWLYMTCGLVRIARSELEAWAARMAQDQDAKQTVKITLFDTSDGIRNQSTAGHFSPQVTKSPDGKLWFLPWDGLSVIDPRHTRTNELPPPVDIEQITADRRTYLAKFVSGNSVHLPPLIRDLQIDYTALSLVAPEKILFRYKLENWDRDWQEVGNRRQAFYNNLPPGNYRFRVVACNNSGLWNEAGAFVDFTITPAYYQTMWFRVLIVAVFLISLALIYQLRLQQVARQVRARMEERLEERERIARDLHDTLIQSVQGLILKFHVGIQQIPRNMPAYEALEKTLDHADEVLAEGRDRVRNLRTPTILTGGLPAAFKRLVEETPQSDHATFKTVVEGSLRELHPMVSEECYCIGREAIVNALTHSGGDKVEVEITYDSRQFRLRVRDNGRGFDPKILEEGGRPNHWGLQGMRERADKIGAQLKLWSRQATGTEVELIVPGATAYQARQNKWKGFKLRRSSSSTGE